MKMHNADDRIACKDPGTHKMSTRAFRTLEFTSSRGELVREDIHQVHIRGICEGAGFTRFKGELVRGDIHGYIHGVWLHKFQKQTCEGTIEGRYSQGLASQVPEANL